MVPQHVGPKTPKKIPRTHPIPMSSLKPGSHLSKSKTDDDGGCCKYEMTGPTPCHQILHCKTAPPCQSPQMQEMHLVNGKLTVHLPMSTGIALLVELHHCTLLNMLRGHYQCSLRVRWRGRIKKLVHAVLRS